MTNPYFERPSSVAAGTTIRSDKYNSDLDTHESAFNALHDRLQHAVFLPETFTGNPNIPEQTVNDTFIYIDTSGNIALYPIATILEQFELVEQRYNQINAWQAQVAEDAIEAQDSATLSQRFANEAENVEVVSGLYSAKHWAKHAEAQIPLLEAAGQAKVDAAQVKVDEAQTKVTLAQNYANAAKNTQVEPGFYSAKHYALVAADQIPLIEAAAQAKVDDAQAQVSLATTQANNATTQATNAANSATKADNFANYAHNQLVPNSGGKYSSYHWAKEAEAYAQQTLDTVNGDFVPSTRTVNGKALSQNIIIGTADIQGLSTVASSGSYDDLTNKPTVASLGAAPEVHGHSDYVVKSSNATLNALTTNGGVVVGGAIIQDSFKQSSAHIGSVPPNTTSYLYLGTYRTGVHKLDFTTLGNSAYNNASYTVDLVFSSDGNTRHPGAKIISSFAGSGATEFGGLLSVKLTSDKAALYLKYVTPNATQNVYVTVNSTAKNGAHDLNESETWTTPNASNESSYLMPIGILDIGTDEILRFKGSEVYHASNLPNPVQTGDLATVATSGSYNDLSNKPTTTSLGAVPTTRTVNGKALSSNITLNASDVSALPSSTTLATLGGVPTSRQVNGKALTSNITLNHTDVGALSNAEKATKIQRVTGSFTATRLAGVTEYVTTATGNSTCTINDNVYAANEKLVIHKQRQGGQLNIVSGNLIYLQDGTSAASHHIPAGYACTVELVFTGSSSELRIYN